MSNSLYRVKEINMFNPTLVALELELAQVPAQGLVQELELAPELALELELAMVQTLQPLQQSRRKRATLLWLLASWWVSWVSWLSSVSLSTT
jgi:hypothetical protein